MKPSQAHRAVAELERRAAVRLAAMHAELTRLAHARNDLIARNAHARSTLLARSRCSGFECFTLAAHTVWTGVAASALLAAHHAQLARSAMLARERMHWARCRVGLERRTRQAGTGRSARQTAMERAARQTAMERSARQRAMERSSLLDRCSWPD